MSSDDASSSPRFWFNFDLANMLDLSRDDHFYRPVIETWFFATRHS